jgi:hypothetical protein
MKRKIAKIILFTFLLSNLIFSSFAFAYSTEESEPNDSLEQAELLGMNRWMKGKISHRTDVDCYKFTGNGKKLAIGVHNTPPGTTYGLVIMDKNMNIIARSDDDCMSQWIYLRSNWYTDYYAVVYSTDGIVSPYYTYTISLGIRSDQ